MLRVRRGNADDLLAAGLLLICVNHLRLELIAAALDLQLASTPSVWHLHLPAAAQLQRLPYPLLRSSQQRCSTLSLSFNGFARKARGPGHQDFMTVMPWQPLQAACLDHQ